MLTLIIFPLLLPGLRCSPAVTHLTVTHVGPCGDDKLVVSVGEMTISTQRYDSFFSGGINVTEDVDNGWKVKATLKKCQDIRNTDTCDLYNSFYLVKDGCSEVDDEVGQDIYGMLFHYTMPEIECPVKSGTYYLDEYPFFTEDNYVTATETKISTSVFGYMCLLEGYSTNDELIFCAEASLQLLYLRQHNWLENENRTKSH